MHIAFLNIQGNFDPEERRGLPLVICSSRLEAKKNHVGLVLAFAHSSELQAAANLLLVFHGLEDLRHGMGLSDEEQPIMDKIVATCEAARLWGKVAGCSLQGQTELAAAYRHLGQRRSVVLDRSAISFVRRRGCWSIRPLRARS